MNVCVVILFKCHWPTIVSKATHFSDLPKPASESPAPRVRLSRRLYPLRKRSQDSRCLEFRSKSTRSSEWCSSRALRDVMRRFTELSDPPRSVVRSLKGRKEFQPEHRGFSSTLDQRREYGCWGGPRSLVATLLTAAHGEPRAMQINCLCRPFKRFH